MATGNSTPLMVFTQTTINNNNNFATTCCNITNCRITTLENWLLLMLGITKLQNYQLEMYNKHTNFYHGCVTRIVLSAGRISVNLSTVSSRILTWRKWLQTCKAYGTQRVYSPANREKKKTVRLIRASFRGCTRKICYGQSVSHVMRFRDSHAIQFNSCVFLTTRYTRVYD